MEKIFLDANYFIDLIMHRSEAKPDDFESFSIFVSSLSLHIFIYLSKKKLPWEDTTELFDYYNFVAMDVDILSKALCGPTSDFEDNVQLHSAVVSDCSIFLTRDKDILKLGYFGSVRISSSL